VIIDTHLHVWELHSERYPWRPLAGVAPDYGWPVENQIEVMDQSGIDKGVLVQPSMYSFDNRYILDCAWRYPERFRLIGLVDPRADTVESSMESLAERGVRGLRLGPMLRPDIPWYGDRQADRVWKKAAELDMIITLLVTPDQVAPATEAIKRFPGVRVVVDHLARPDKADDPGGSQFEDLLALAQFEQVYVKVSALGFMSHESYPHRDMLDLVRRVFDAFGPERLMWGTDTPMSQDPTTVPDALRLIDIALPDSSPDDRMQIKGGTAARLFGWIQ
jgi:L-fuconolactonase